MEAYLVMYGLQLVAFAYNWWHFIYYGVWIITSLWSTIRFAQWCCCSKRKSESSDANDSPLHPSPHPRQETASFENDAWHGAIQPAASSSSTDNRLVTAAHHISSSYRACCNHYLTNAVKMILSISLILLFGLGVRAVYFDWVHHRRECDDRITRDFNEYNDEWLGFCVSPKAPPERALTAGCRHAYFMIQVTRLDHNITECALREMTGHIPGWNDNAGLFVLLHSVLDVWRTSLFALFMVSFVLALALLLYIWRMPVQYAQSARHSFLRRKEPSTASSTISKSLPRPPAAVASSSSTTAPETKFTPATSAPTLLDIAGDANTNANAIEFLPPLVCVRQTQMGLHSPRDTTPEWYDGGGAGGGSAVAVDSFPFYQYPQSDGLAYASANVSH